MITFDAEGEMVVIDSLNLHRWSHSANQYYWIALSNGEKTEMNFHFIRENLIRVSVLDECSEFFLWLNEISLGQKTRLRFSEIEYKNYLFSIM